MKKSIVIKRFTAGSMFKIVAIGCSITIGGLAVVAGLFALFGADTVYWNSQTVKGMNGFAAVPLIILLAIFATLILWIAFTVSFWLFSLFGRLEVDYVTNEREFRTDEPDTSVYLCGELDGGPSKKELNEVLRQAGLQTQVGRYKITVCNCSHFRFVDCGPDDFDIDAHADSPEAMLREAGWVSEALAKAGIRHRFEIYAQDDEMVGYLHHNWPLEDQA